MIAEGHHRSITQPLARRLRVSGSRLLTPGFSHSCTISPSLPRSARGSPRSVANKPFSINRHSVKSFRFHSYEECPFSPRFLSCKSPRIKRHFAKSFRSHSYKKRASNSFISHSYKISGFQVPPNHTLTKKGWGGHPWPAAISGDAPSGFLPRYFITSLSLPAFCRCFITSSHPYIVSLRNHDQTK